MRRLTMTRPPEWDNEEDTGDLHNHFVSLGYRVDGVSPHRDGTVTVDLIEPLPTGRDPDADLTAFTPQGAVRLMAIEQIIQDGRVVFRVIRQKPRADRTPVERALLALAVAQRLDSLQD